MWMYLKSSNIDTATKISEKLGTYSVQSYGESSNSNIKYDNSSSSMSLISRKLLTPDEVLKIESPNILVMIAGKSPALLNVPDISKMYFNKLNGMGTKEENQKLRITRENERTIRQISKVKIWNIWDKYKNTYEEDIDNIVGILHIRDAMQSYLDGPARKKPVHDLKDAIRPAGFIPETKAIDKLFQQMQQDKSHMVIVLDEYGQTSGIVTMEDIVEEIVGNIQDEYDEEEELIIKQADGTYIVDGMTQLEDLEELLGISFNEEDYDTINGYLIDCLDRIPSEDEECQVEFGGYLFHVLSVDNNTIRKVLVSRTKK